MLLFCFISFSWAEQKKPNKFAIASAHPEATFAAIKVLNEGGNAFDAAVTISSVLAVVEPYHSGLGGGGFFLLHLAKENKDVFIDAREKAPLNATRNMFLNKYGMVLPFASLNGPLAAAIPGEPAALVYIANNYGNLPLARTLAPAIELANKGFKVDPLLEYFLENRLSIIRQYPETARIFLKNNEPYKIGDTLIQRDLGNTLQALANLGHDGFYKGNIAKLLVEGVTKSSGIWSLKDLESYQIKIKEPLKGYYKEMAITTAPLPSAGGIALLTMLGILEKFNLNLLPDITKIHYIIEAMRLSFWQRSLYLGDDDFIKIDLKVILNSKNFAFLQSLIKPNKALDNFVLKSLGEVKKAPGNTTHFSILDKEGNMVSATLTINYYFGSCFIPPGTGVILNDEMDDFAVKPKYASNIFGVVGSEANSIEPGKRPLSNMSPSFLEVDNKIAILGTPGGSRIPTMVLLAALKFYETFSAINMISTLRFHHQYLPDILQFEPNAFSEKIKQQLIDMGYHLFSLQEYYGDMQVVTWDKNTNFVDAVSDPRRYGMAVVH